MGRLIVVIVAVVAGALAALAAVRFGLVPGLSTAQTAVTSTGATAAAAASPSSTAQRVVALARLEPAGGIVELAGMPGDRIEKLAVKPGQVVRRDEDLVVFESQTLRSLEREAAQAQLDEATSRLKAEQLHADSLVRSAQLAVDGLVLDDLELAAQRTRLQSLQKGVEIAKRNHDRLTRLDKSITSSQELEQSELVRDQAAIDLTAAQQMIEKLEAGRDLRRREATAGLEQAQAARAKVDAAVPLESLRRAVALVDERLRLSTLRAAGDATVLEVWAEEGDVVGQSPLLRLGDLRTMSARAEVYETQIGAVRVGQSVEITADALPKPIAGTVERIGSVVGSNRLTSLDPRRSTDNRVVEVYIRLNDAAEASRFVNLQVTATINTASN